MSDTSIAATPVAPAPETFWGHIKGLLTADFASIEVFFTGTVWPAMKSFFETVVHDEVAALIPLAEEALAEIMGAVPAISSGSLQTFAMDAGRVLLATAQKAETAGLAVATSSLATAVHGVIAAAQTKLATTGTAA